MRSSMSARTCPNRCGSTPPAGTYACRACWRLLPASLKTPILAAWKAGDWDGHAAAKAAAQAWYDAQAQPAAGAGERACRVCGCTENNACWPPCWWTGPDLCSACPAPAVLSDGAR